MAWVLVPGVDDDLRHSITEALQRAQYEVTTAADGEAVLQVLQETAHHMVVLVEREMGPMPADAFLGFVAVDDGLQRNHAYVLLDQRPGDLPDSVERYRALLGIPAVATPAGASDADGWADLLDAVALAARRLPSGDSR